MKAQYTPAPWTFQGAMNSDRIFVGREGKILQGGYDTIATVRMNGEESAFNQGVQVANARLIAAAPELLEALENAVACLENTMEDVSDDCIESIQQDIDAYKLVISKAKGNQ